jgi:hypothetical protein
MVIGGGACPHPAGPLLSAGGGADAGCREAGQVARCHARCPAGAPAPVITATGAGAASAPYRPARPGPVPPIRTVLTTASALAMVRN